MEITIKGTEKEIAGLVLELQNRQSMVIHENKTPSSLTAESIYETCRKTTDKVYVEINDDGTETRYYYPQGSDDT